MSLPLRTAGRRANAAAKNASPTATVATAASANTAVAVTNAKAATGSATTKPAKKLKAKPAPTTNVEPVAPAAPKPTPMSKWDATALRSTLGLDTDDAISTSDARRIVQTSNVLLLDASNALSSLIDPLSKSPSNDEVAAIAACCQIALQAARKWSDKKLEVERRAGSIVSKLIALEKMDCARELLGDIRAAVAQLYAHSNSCENGQGELTIPLPEDRTTISQDLLTLILATLIQTLFTSPSHPTFIVSLYVQGSLYTWLHLFLPSSPSPTTSTHTIPDTTIRRAYSSISRHPHFSAKLASLRIILLSSQLDADNFWGQTLSFAGTHVKSAGTDAKKQKEVCRDVCAMYEDLVGRAGEGMREGEGWVKVAKHWNALARRMSDAKTLEKVSGYLQQSPKHDYALECAQVCARLMRIGSALGAYLAAPSSASSAASMDDRPSTPPPSSKSPLSALPAHLQPQHSRPTNAAKDAESERDALLTKDINDTIAILAQANPKRVLGDGQVMSEMERIRRVCAKWLEAQSQSRSSSNEGLKECVRKLVFAVIKPEKQNVYLDSIITLARTTLDPSNQNSWDAAYSYLERGYDMLYLKSSSGDRLHALSLPASTTDKEKEKERENALFLHALGNAYSNSGGMLYNAERWGAAVRFFEKATKVGVDAVAISRARVLGVDNTTVDQTSGKKTNGKEKEGSKGNGKERAEEETKEYWDASQKRIGRVWECMGRCWMRLGERKKAHKCYLSSLASSLLSLGSDTATALPLPENLVLLIERITSIAVLDLFMDSEEVTLLPTLSSGSLEGQVPSEVQAAVLEIQIRFLRAHTKKRGVEGIVREMIESVVGLYEGMPVRKARAQLSLLELAFLSKSDLVDTRRVVKDIDEGCLNAFSKKSTSDANLTPLLPLYRAGAWSWAALIAHTRRDARGEKVAEREIAECVERVAAILGEYKVSLRESAEKKDGGEEEGKKGRKALKRGMGAKSRAGSKTTAAKGKKTQPLSEVLESAKTVPMTPEQANEASALKEGREYTFHILDVIAKFCGLMGHLVPRVGILDALREVGKVVGDMDVHVLASLQLAKEFLHMGLATPARAVHDELSAMMSSNSAAVGLKEELRIQMLLGYAEMMAVSDVEQGIKLYEQAFVLAEKIVDESDSSAKKSTTEVLANKIEAIERTVEAIMAYCAIVDSQNNMHDMFQLQQQAMRLWTRAAEYLTRYGVVEAPTPPRPTKTKARTTSPNPFNVTDLKEAVQEIELGAKTTSTANLPEGWRTFHYARTINGAEWRVASGLLSSIHNVIESYIRRGSAKAALRLVEDAEVLTTMVGSRALRARMLVRKGEILIGTGEMQEGQRVLEEAREVLNLFTSSELAEIPRMLGMFHALNSQVEDADDMFDEGITMLQNLERLLGEASPIVAAMNKDVFAGNMVADLLRESVWLCRQEQNGEDFMGALELLVDSSQSTLSKGLLHLLMGKLAMYSAHEYFSGSLCLSSLTESTISLPLGMSGPLLRTTPSTLKVMELLSEAESSFDKSMIVLHRRGPVATAREASLCYALSRAFQTSLGAAASTDSITLANLLDVMCSFTLSREMLEAIDMKLVDPRAQRDLRWPSANVVGTSQSNLPDSQSMDLDDVDDIESGIVAGFRYKDYWRSVRSRYSSLEPSVKALSQSSSDLLPSNWSVVSISTTEDKSALLVSRQRASGNPLTFCIPLSRHGRKEEEDEDQQLSFSDAIQELEEIVSASNAQAKAAVDIQGREAKAAWWSERRTLNSRMKELVENIEFCWLGGFKGIFSSTAVPNQEFFESLRTRLESAFARVLRLNLKGKPLPPLDDVLLECFAALPAQCRDEELEDLIYFMLDLYQLHSVPVALAEVDMDEVVVEVRSVLEEAAARYSSLPRVEDAHMFLVLDKNVQGIPWESIPMLRGKTISRIPSLSFLIDRLEMDKFYDRSPDARGFRVNPSRAFYVMNPSGDLKSTENTFRDWATEMEPHGWKGLIGRAPMETELINALESRDLFLYFGHGNGEQFIRSRKIKSLRRCAATMIWGCSSGFMKDMGSFDRTGTPAHYMLAGCPTLVANLWDVTDRDMDKFTMSVFDKIGLTKDRVAQWHRTTRNDSGNFNRAPATADSISIAEAIATSREVCKMDFLVGAAPVMYGVPFYI